MESSYDKKFNLRLPTSVFNRIEQLGTQYERSINEQIVYMLKTWEEPIAFAERLTRLEAHIYGESQKRIVGQ